MFYQALYHGPSLLRDIKVAKTVSSISTTWNGRKVVF